MNIEIYQIDTDVVTTAKYILGSALGKTMINRTGEEHEKHPCNEEDNSKSHLPSKTHGRPCHPYARQRKDYSYEMCPSVTLLHHFLSLNVSGWHKRHSLLNPMVVLEANNERSHGEGS